ncbi:MAG: ZIP family metal transporter [Nevskiales bacterium]
MSSLLLLVVFSLLGGLLSAVAAGLFLILRPQWQQRALPSLVSLAIGALLGAAFIGLLPHAAELHGGDLHQLGVAVLVGILLFFVLEKVLLWRHSHTGHGEDHAHCEHPPPGRAAASLVLFGDATHNLVDGLLIGAAFLVDVKLGILTSLAVAAHEIPQELGDLAVLLHAGLRPARAFLLNLLTSLGTVVGALAGYFALDPRWLPYALALAAASFIYVAMADLIPGLQQDSGLVTTLRQLLLIVAGSAAIYATHAAMH